MICPICQAPNPDVARFCIKCGTRLTPDAAAVPDDVVSPTVSVSLPPVEPTPAADAPVTRKRSKRPFVLAGVGAAVLLLACAGGGAWLAFDRLVKHAETTPASAVVIGTPSATATRGSAVATPTARSAGGTTPTAPSTGPTATVRVVPATPSIAPVAGKRVDAKGLEVYLLSSWGVKGTDIAFNRPYAIALDAAGNAYVTDQLNSQVQKLSPDGRVLTKFGTKGNGDGQFDMPLGIALDKSGNVYVVDSAHRIEKFGADGRFLATWGSFVGWGADPGDDGKFNTPSYVAVDSQGFVYVTDTYANRIQKFSPDGKFVAKWGTAGDGDGQFRKPRGIAVDAADNVYVVDQANNRIQKFNAQGRFLAKSGSKGSADGQFDTPSGIAVDKSGNIFVAELSLSKIQKFGPDGKFLGSWGSEGAGDGQFLFPEGLAFDQAGRLYVVDGGNHRVRLFSLR